jgi:hypothetical protein
MQKLPSWSIKQFAQIHGKSVKLTTPFLSKEGKTFRKIAFSDPTQPDKQATLVGFSDKLGELSASELVAQQHSLQIVQLQSGSFKICRTADTAWETIDFDL